MPRIDNFTEQTQQQDSFNSQKNQNQFNSQAQNNQNSFNSAQTNQDNAQSLNQPKGLLTLPPSILQMVPWIPLMLEMTTGQKVPQMSGTIGEIQNSLVQIQASLSQVVNYQQQLWNKLTSLEANTNNSFRLLATETKRSLELYRNGQDNPYPSTET